MTQKIRNDLYLIKVPLPNNPLQATNSYFIRGADRDLLIDTGFNVPECREALDQALNELGSKKERRMTFATHMHADHMGLIGSLAGEGMPVYMSEADLTYYREKCGEEFDEARFLTMTEEGFPAEELREAMELNAKRIARPMDLPDSFVGLKDQDVIEVGNYRLKLLLVPGHSPGNSMLYDEEKKLLFTGDHALFGISPNITSFPGFRNALGRYLDSLHQYEDLDVELALPGHRQSGDYRQRVQELFAHHEKRLEETMRVIMEHPGSSAYEIAGHMTWRIRSAKGWDDFPLQQKYYAMGECLSHLDYLLEQGKVKKYPDQNGILVYDKSL